MSKNVVSIQVFLKGGDEVKGILESKDTEVYRIKTESGKVVPVRRSECTQINMITSPGVTQVKDIKGGVWF